MLKRILKSLASPHQIATLKRAPAIREMLERADWKDWEKRGFAAPPPPFVKRAAIRRNAIAGGTFVESGTFLGDTTLEAATYSKRVVTIEASPELCIGLRRRFAPHSNIELQEGRSQEVLPGILKTVSGDVTFWLDAHASGGITYEDVDVTSIRSELETIERCLDHLGNIVVMVDDIRGFGRSPHYPDVAFMIDWAASNQMAWTIELDMMCFRRLPQIAPIAAR